MKYFIAGVCVLMLAGCASAYYNTMEKFGVHKRDILVDRVEEARDGQKDAQKQFKSALEQFKSVVVIDGGNIEKIYNRLDGEYQSSVHAAEQIKAQISAIESVSKALFKEWQSELSQYTNPNLRRDSEKKLQSTKAKYQALFSTLKQTESRLQPVLNAMHDQVLYLKHNLNARAIQALKRESIKIDRDVDVLLDAMGKSIDQADAFIATLKQ